MSRARVFLLAVALSVVGFTSFFFKNKLVVREPEEEKVFFAAVGIVPHHLLASKLTAEFFNRLSAQNPRTIILVGPNHQEKGGIRPLTSLADWNTSSGIVEANQDLIQKFVSLGLVKVNGEVLSTEHSISELVPFIKDFLPEASVFPVVLSGKITFEEIKTLAEELSGEMNEETVLVAAVDFSHRLKPEDARQNDLQTLGIMKDFDYPKLLSLGNDFLDSPPSIALLLIVVQETGRTNFEVLSHTNSGELMNDDFAETTSYFVIRYY